MHIMPKVTQAHVLAAWEEFERLESAEQDSYLEKVSAKMRDDNPYLSGMLELLIKGLETPLPEDDEWLLCVLICLSYRVLELSVEPGALPRLTEEELTLFLEEDDLQSPTQHALSNINRLIVIIQENPEYMSPMHKLLVREGKMNEGMDPSLGVMSLFPVGANPGAVMTFSEFQTIIYQAFRRRFEVEAMKKSLS